MQCLPGLALTIPTTRWWGQTRCRSLQAAGLSHSEEPSTAQNWIGREGGTDQPLPISLRGNWRRSTSLIRWCTFVPPTPPTVTPWITHEGTSPRDTFSAIVLTVSPYRMSVFFQGASLHFLRSSVHLSMRHKKKKSMLEFCGFEEKTHPSSFKCLKTWKYK